MTSPVDRFDRARLALATDLDGTFLGGTPVDRRALYAALQDRQAGTTLIFVTGRDLPFVRELVARGEVPRPDFVIGDVGTTVAGGPDLEPIPALETDIVLRWGDAGERVRQLLADEPGLTPQPTPFRYRQSYYYDPGLLRPEALRLLEQAGLDWLLSADTYLDVLPRGISKGPTLLTLVAYLRLPDAQVLTAGDTLNDLSLFETGLAGVAVGNAEEALRARVARMSNVYLASSPGAAGILEGARHFGFI